MRPISGHGFRVTGREEEKNTEKLNDRMLEMT